MGGREVPSGLQTPPFALELAAGGPARKLATKIQGLSTDKCPVPLPDALHTHRGLLRALKVKPIADRFKLIEDDDLYDLRARS